MLCAIYKGPRAPDTYLFVPGHAALEEVPENVRRGFGPLEHVMDLVLTPERRLARIEARELMRRLLRDGCFIQMPPEEDKATVRM